jgi:hypothetical protein
LHRGDDLAQQHVKVARLAQLASQPGHRLTQRVVQFRRQRRAEQAQGRPQAPRCHPHLVDVFDIVAVQGAVVVLLQVFQAGQRDAAKGGEGRQFGVKSGGMGFHRRRRYPAVQAVAALGLGQHGWRQGDALGQFAGKVEQGLYRRSRQFQFEFGNRLAPAVGDHPAAIQGQQHRAARCRQLPGVAAETRFAYRDDARQQAWPFQPGAQLGLLDGRELEVAAVGGFPFWSAGKAGGGGTGELYRLQPELALAAQP